MCLYVRKVLINYKHTSASDKFVHRRMFSGGLDHGGLEKKEAILVTGVVGVFSKPMSSFFFSFLLSSFSRFPFYASHAEGGSHCCVRRHCVCLRHRGAVELEVQWSFAHKRRGELFWLRGDPILLLRLKVKQEDEIS